MIEHPQVEDEDGRSGTIVWYGMKLRTKSSLRWREVGIDFFLRFFAVTINGSTLLLLQKDKGLGQRHAHNESGCLNE